MIVNSDRFKDAPWLSLYSEGVSVAIIGVGGIGSHTAYIMANTLNIDSLTLIDPDEVETHNIGTQFYARGQVGMYKASALANTIRTTSNTLGIVNVYNTKVEDTFNSLHRNNIIVIAVDSIVVRKKIFSYLSDRVMDNEFFKHLPIIIDGRLNATSYETFAITDVTGNYEERRKAYENSLISEETLGEGSCTMRQTYFFGTLIASRITNLATNYLSNLGYKRKCKVENKPYAPIFDVPFHIKEIGDGMLFMKESATSYFNKTKNYKKEE